MTSSEGVIGSGEEVCSVGVTVPISVGVTVPKYESGIFAPKSESGIFAPKSESGIFAPKYESGMLVHESGIFAPKSESGIFAPELVAHVFDSGAGGVPEVSLHDDGVDEVSFPDDGGDDTDESVFESPRTMIAIQSKFVSVVTGVCVSIVNPVTILSITR